MASTTHTYAGGIDHYSATFQAPIQDGVRNIVKQGNVIPVKLLLANCTGQPVPWEDPLDRIRSGRRLRRCRCRRPRGARAPFSNADTNGFMRQVDGKYMYNLATKTMKVNLPYTVVIREPLSQLVRRELRDLSPRRN